MFLSVFYEKIDLYILFFTAEESVCYTRHKSEKRNHTDDNRYNKEQSG